MCKKPVIIHKELNSFFYYTCYFSVAFDASSTAALLMLPIKTRYWYYRRKVWPLMCLKWKEAVIPRIQGSISCQWYYLILDICLDSTFGKPAWSCFPIEPCCSCWCWEGRKTGRRGADCFWITRHVKYWLVVGMLQGWFFKPKYNTRSLTIYWHIRCLLQFPQPG